MMKNLMFICLIAFLCACSSNKKKQTDQKEVTFAPQPAKLLTELEMVQVIADLHLAEATASLKSYQFDKGLRHYHVFETEILKKYGIDTSLYRQNYEFYMQNFEATERIYNAVDDSLVVRRNRQIEQDSLRNKK